MRRIYSPLLFFFKNRSYVLGYASMTFPDIHISFCTIAALNSRSLCYRVCRACEAPVPDYIHGPMVCISCGARLSENGTQMLYRLQLSIATEDKVFPVVAFDRAARSLMGCSADEFYHFASCNPCAVENVSKVLLGEMVELMLRPPKSGRAQHMRV
ncbi:hypothetical protein GOP47_0023972 [Adiantum capillus-veneris]|uniref:Replication factor A C-terminal domain-containing protein n=1 Tax=Adiantum capillus-veneris TaxID=13818 RepID=A0A9D4U5N0_ADICA|nr:hypothetical protein GOP47_0023972 [Adiantum capillus-veneris]